MQPRLTLTYYDDAGRPTRVDVTSRRFTIGRDLSNDLMIEHSSLSRRHALIEGFDNVLRISDCGSINGTFVNGNRLQFPVELCDGDVINLAEACEIEVELNKEEPNPLVDAVRSNEIQPLSHEAMKELDRSMAARSAPRVKGAAATNYSTNSSRRGAGLLDRLDLRIILPGITLMILVLVGLVIALKGSGVNPKPLPDRPIMVNRETPVPAGTLDTPSEKPPMPADSSGAAQLRTEIDDELDEVEKNTLTVMRDISLRDSNPVLTQSNDQEIYKKIQSYRGSARLRDNLRLMKSRGIPQLAAAAKARGIKMPLLVFAALARVDKEGQGDPVAAAMDLIPDLAKNQIYLAKDMAHDNLLALAATDPSSGGAMALRDAIAALSNKHSDKGVQAIRNVWYLRDVGVLKPSAFDLVMRFLAIGAIAQNPQHYGIDAERLSFDH